MLLEIGSYLVVFRSWYCLCSLCALLVKFPGTVVFQIGRSVMDLDCLLVWQFGDGFRLSACLTGGVFWITNSKSDVQETSQVRGKGSVLLVICSIVNELCELHPSWNQGALPLSSTLGTSVELFGFLLTPNLTLHLQEAENSFTVLRCGRKREFILLDQSQLKSWV